LVTLSEEGMLLQVPEMEAVHVPAHPVRIRDVSGAGDTVVAVLALLLAMGANFEPAARVANAAASVVVGKSGTATVSTQELRARILPAAALASEERSYSIGRWRKSACARGVFPDCGWASPMAASISCTPAT
jgi:D-beta-D-heptose 7-phosphate kinase/D-beta-D-heptose 1-phosphate adenosyltransferase